MKSLDSLRRSILPTLILAAIVALPQPLFANTLTVTNLGDSGMNGQLRTLITLAAPGDTIVIPAGTITLAGPSGDNLNQGGDLDISKNLTIQGAGPDMTIIDGAGIDRVLHIDPSEQGGIEVTISGLTIRNGKTPGFDAAGGGMKNTLGTVMLTNLTVSANTTAFNGGGIFSDGGAMTLTNVTISDNTAGGFVGGIANTSGTVTATNVTISDNTAGAAAGGLGNLSGTVTLTNVTISGNTASFAGGGIGNGSGNVTLINSTVSGNMDMFGGGIANSAAGSVTLMNVTLSSNSGNTSGGGGGIFAGGGSVQLKNTIVANSPSGGNCSGTITSLGHNLDSETTCAFNQPTDRSNANPLLGPLQDNGGLTQTHALLPGSPAIDGGDPAGCTDNLGAPLSEPR